MKATTPATHFVAAERHHCPSQPCTTLDDLLLNNNLSNISNVEFNLLPGVYNVTSNIVLQHVYNVSFVGSNVSNVIINCDENAFVLAYSHNVTISNLIFQHCDGTIDQLSLACTEGQDTYLHHSAHLLFVCCSFMSMHNVYIWNYMYIGTYALIGLNIVGISTFTNITLPPHWGIVMLYLNSTVDYSNQNNTLLISRLTISGTFDHSKICPYFGYGYTLGLNIILKQDHYDISVIASEITFDNYEMDPLINVKINSYQSFNNVVVKRCKFEYNRQTSCRHDFFFRPMIEVIIPHIHASVSFVNCVFMHNSFGDALISVKEVSNFHRMVNWCEYVSKIYLSGSSFDFNIFSALIYFYGADMPQVIPSCMINVFITGITNMCNTQSKSHHLVFIKCMSLHLKGKIFVFSNVVRDVIALDSSIVTFYKSVRFLSNHCTQIINLKSLYTYAIVMEYSTIIFKSNNCSNQLILTESINITPYPFCVFQYFTFLHINKSIVAPEILKQLFTIKFINNFQSQPTILNWLTSHCQWLPNAVFQKHDPGVINKIIMQINNPIKQGLVLNRHTNLCYCSVNETQIY